MNSESFATLPYIISVIGIANGFILGLYLLFTKVGRRRANIFLGIFLLMISFRIFRSWFVLYHGYNPWISNIAYILIFMAAPVLYNYFKVGLKGESKLNYIDFLFIIPLMSMFFMRFKIINYCSLANMLFYIMLSFIIFKNYAFPSNTSKKLIKHHDYIWYRNLIIIILLSILGYSLNVGFNLLPYITGAIGYSFLIYVMVYFWSKHQKIRKQNDELKKSNSSLIPTNDINEHINRLKELMIKEKVYKDYTLTLTKLANILNISHHQLSQLLNQNIGKNFADYINEYRTQEAMILLTNIDYKYETAENIGYESGFSNTSSFYTAFKKFTGTSPSKFRNERIKI